MEKYTITAQEDYMIKMHTLRTRGLIDGLTIGERTNESNTKTTNLKRRKTLCKSSQNITIPESGMIVKLVSIIVDIIIAIFQRG